jgi:hypothetical protein
MMRKAFSIHSDYYGELRSLTKGQRGALLLALIEWATNGEPPPLDPESAILFRLMSSQNERISEVYSKNGVKGGAPKGNQNASKTTKNNLNKLNKPTVTNTVPEAVPDTVTVTEPDIYDDDDARAGACESEINEGARKDASEIIRYHFGREPTPSERDTCTRLLSQYTPELVDTAFYRAAKEKICTLAYACSVLDDFRKKGVVDYATLADYDFMHESRQCEKKNRRVNYARQRESPCV